MSSEKKIKVFGFLDLFSKRSNPPESKTNHPFVTIGHERGDFNQLNSLFLSRLTCGSAPDLHTGRVWGLLGVEGQP